VIGRARDQTGNWLDTQRAIARQIMEASQPVHPVQQVQFESQFSLRVVTAS
jgi:hypothetical protein